MATPLILAALGIIVAFRCKFWNIGAEGQLLLGAAIAAWLGMSVKAPFSLMLPLLFSASFMAGAMWGVIPGYLKAKLQVNEIITTLMMNFIALLFVSFLVEDLLKEEGALFPRTPPILPAAQLPKLIPGTRLHAGFIVAVALSILVYLVLQKTIFGYRIRSTGSNPLAARYGGINVTRYTIYAVILSGGLAGMAGMGEVSGVHYRLVNNISPGYGYFAIIVALLGRLHPIAVVLTGIFFGGLIVGSSAMTSMTVIPGAFMYVLQAFILIFMLGIDSMMEKMKLF